MRRANVVEALRLMGVPTKRDKGRWIETRCPFAGLFDKSREEWPYTYHPRGAADRDPVFAVEAKAPHRFTCLKCGHRGTLAALPAMVAAVSPGDLRPHYREITDVVSAMEEGDYFAFDDAPEYETPPEPWLEQAWTGVFQPIEDHEEAVGYMVDRGITKGAADRLGLLFDQDEGRIMFPLRDGQGRLWGWTGRSTRGANPKVRTWPGTLKSRQVLGTHAWAPGLPILVVEGNMGLAHLVGVAADIVNVGAVMGKMLSSEQAGIVFARYAPTYLLFDNDEAGRAGQALAEKTLEATDLRSLSWPRWREPGWHVRDGEEVEHLAGEAKDDPDQLDRRDVEEMLATPRKVPAWLDFDMNVY